MIPNPRIAQNTHASIDGNSIDSFAKYRAQAPSFALDLPDDNIFGAQAGTYEPSAADVVYLLVAPLPPGDHVITFGTQFGSNPPIEVTYHLHVAL